MGIKALAAAVVLCAGSGALIAQPLAPKALAVATQQPDLRFPDEAKTLSIFSPLTMAIYKPEGDGPFPAVVLVHTCGGLGKEIREWTKRALERKFVVFVTDSYGQRGIQNGCYPPKIVPIPRGAKDAFQALEHLGKFPFVDKERVALIGFSWGGMVGLAVSGNGIASQLSTARFNAVVSFYPACYFPPRPNYPGFEFLRQDTDRPLLVLMGEEDTETPVADCLPRLESLKRASAPVEWHVYPGTTHCWDCFSLHNFSKTDFRGVQVVYRYDEKVTEDSVQRTFEFLARHLSPR